MRLVHDVVADVQVGEGGDLAALLLLRAALAPLGAVDVAAGDERQLHLRILEARGERQRIDAALAGRRRALAELVKRGRDALVLQRGAQAFAAGRAAGEHHDAPAVPHPAGDVRAHLARLSAVAARAHAAHLGKERGAQALHRAQDGGHRQQGMRAQRVHHLLLREHEIGLCGQRVAALERAPERLTELAGAAVHAGVERLRLIEHDDGPVHVIEQRLGLRVKQMDELFEHAPADALAQLTGGGAQVLLEALHGAALPGEGLGHGDLAVLERQVGERRLAILLLLRAGIGGLLALQQLDQPVGERVRPLERGGSLAGGRDDDLLQIALRALAHHVEQADGVDLVVEELHAHGVQAVRGVDVDDAAAQGELPLALDHVLTGIARAEQAAAQRVGGHGLAHAQADRMRVEQRARHDAVQQRIDGRDDGAGFAGDEALQRLDAPAGDLAAGGDLLIEGDLARGEAAHAAPEQGAHVLHGLRGGLFAVAQEQQRPAGLRGERAGEVGLLRSGQAGGGNDRAGLFALGEHLLKRLEAAQQVKQKMRLHESSS